MMTTPRWGAGRPARVIRATGRACRSGTPMVSPLLSVGTIQRAAPARKAPAVYPAAARGALSACRRASVDERRLLRSCGRMRCRDRGETRSRRLRR